MLPLLPKSTAIIVSYPVIFFNTYIRIFFSDADNDEFLIKTGLLNIQFDSISGTMMNGGCEAVVKIQ